jgi:hypothetical protein
LFPGGSDRDELERICSELNSEASGDRRHELRRLLNQWQEVGQDLAAMLSADAALKKALQEAFRPEYFAGNGPRARLVLTPDKRTVDSPSGWAVVRFAAITLNREGHKLRGPCAYGPCGRYFVSKRESPSLYCSRRCCQAASAVRHRRRFLEAERQDKLRRATAAIRNWRGRRSRIDWKRWVCRCEPDITVRFLTRAVNRGDLGPPPN